MQLCCNWQAYSEGPLQALPFWLHLCSRPARGPWLLQS